MTPAITEHTATPVIIQSPEGGSKTEARYLPDDRQIQIVSRTVTEMRVTVPPQWAQAKLLWNGLPMENIAENIKEPGCWMLTMQKELLNAAPCP